MIVSITSFRKKLNLSLRTLYKILDYLNISIEERNGRKYIDNEVEDKINSFLFEHLNTKKFFTELTNLKNHGTKTFTNIEKRKRTKLEKYGDEHFNNVEKRKKTNIEKYGVENYASTDECKNKVKKSNLEKYGKEYFTQTKEFVEKREQSLTDKFGSFENFMENQVKKSKQTKLERYGDENYTNDEKKRNTCIEKYGVEHYFSSNNFKSNSIEFRKNAVVREKEELEKQLNCKLIGTSDLVLEYEKCNGTLLNCFDFMNIETFVVGGHECFIRESDLFKVDEYFENTALKFTSSVEKEIQDYVKSLGVEIICRSKSIINPLELDIYIHSKKVAIEVDGIFYHSEAFIAKEEHFSWEEYKSSKYWNNFRLKHITKTNRCNELGIRLIHIRDDEWLNKQEICKSIIKSSLGIYDEKIYARNCEFKKVDRDLAKLFMNKNHLNGSLGINNCYGLFYKGELVQCVSFSKDRFKTHDKTSEKDIELLRMCTKLNTQVVGGFSKLMKNQPYDKVFSYVDLSKYNGTGYISSNWKIIQNNSGINYHYFYKSKIYARQLFMKQNLHKWFGDNLNMNKTEHQLCYENGAYKFYTCGNLKLEWNRT